MPDLGVGSASGANELQRRIPSPQRPETTSPVHELEQTVLVPDASITKKQLKIIRKMMRSKRVKALKKTKDAKMLRSKLVKGLMKKKVPSQRPRAVLVAMLVAVRVAAPGAASPLGRVWT